jgi:ubiquinone/menaquinone biosynthesis C-methylase UbiE
MRKIENERDIILQLVEPKNKTIIDVGCGAGGMARGLTEQGARVIGVDTPGMLAKAGEHPPIGNEKYVAARGENLPFKSDFADMIIFAASLHHIPGPMMMQAIKESRRVLETGGLAVFVEPCGQEGSYFELIRLVEDERDIQRLAFEAIKKAHLFGMESKTEEIVYFERSYADYVNLLDIFIEDEDERSGYVQEAGKVTEKLCQAANQTITDYRFKSICRVNVLQRS